MKTEPNIIQISWTEIAPSPLNALVRGNVTENDLEIKDLAVSIMEHGLLQPLLVVERGNGRAAYELVVGERRWLAAKSLGNQAPLLPCQVRPKMTELDQLVVMGVENLQRKNISPITEAQYYHSLLERGLSLEDILHRLGLERGRVTGRLELLQLAPQVQQLIHTQSFPLSAAKHLHDLPVEAQVEVAQKMTGRPVRDIAQVTGLVKKELETTTLANGPVDEKVARAKNVVTAAAPSYKTQVEELKEMLAKMAAYIRVTGQLLAECALTLEEFDPDLALRAGARAQAIEDAILKHLAARKGGRDDDHRHGS